MLIIGTMTGKTLIRKNRPYITVVLHRVRRGIFRKNAIRPRDEIQARENESKDQPFQKMALQWKEGGRWDGLGEGELESTLPKGMNSNGSIIDADSRRCRKLPQDFQ